MSKKVWAETVVAPAWRDLGGDALVDLQVEVGRHQPDRAVVARLDQHVGQDRDGVAPLDHRLDMAQALQECRPFDRRLHCRFAPHPHASPLVIASRSARGRGKSGGGVAAVSPAGAAREPLP